MRREIVRASFACLAVLIFGTTALAADLSPELKTKVDAKIKQFQSLSTDSKVVSAVKEYNANPPADTKGMTQEKWKSLNVLDPIVRGLSKNALAEYLKTKRDDSVAELFVSGADGTKVALFSKTTGWSHKGKEKHELPMKGQTFVGPVEMDQSSGTESVQIGLPVLDGGKPIGSIVIGLAVSKLK
jgi:hypothetical protein